MRRGPGPARVTATVVLCGIALGCAPRPPAGTAEPDASLDAPELARTAIVVLAVDSIAVPEGVAASDPDGAADSMAAALARFAQSVLAVTLSDAGIADTVVAEPDVPDRRPPGTTLSLVPRAVELQLVGPLVARATIEAWLVDTDGRVVWRATVAGANPALRLPPGAAVEIALADAISVAVRGLVDRLVAAGRAGPAE